MDPAPAKRSSSLNNQRVRGLVYQTLLLAGIVALAGGAIYNAVINMRARGIPIGAKSVRASFSALGKTCVSEAGA